MVGQDQKPQVSTNKAMFDARLFFEALAKDRELAYAQLREQVPTHGSATPRAQALIDAGEWDSSERFSIRCLKEGRCLGHVGVTPTGEQTPTRFCGRRLVECTIQSHKNNMWTGFTPGWFIPGGSKAAAGFYKSPRLPTYADGGPISQEAANAILSTHDPFELTTGQWRLAIDSWWEDRVKAASDLSSSFESSRASSKGDDQSPTMDHLKSGPPADMSMFNKKATGFASSQADSTFFPMDPQPPDQSRSSGTKMVEGMSDDIQVLTRTVERLTGKVAVLQTGYDRALKESALAKQELASLASKYEQGMGTSALSQADKDRLEDMESMVSGLASLLRDIQDSNTHLETLVVDPAGPVAQAKSQVEQLSRQVQMGGGVEAHGIRFRDPSEIRAWLATVTDPLAMFHDAVTLLHCIGSASVTHKDSLTMMKAQREANINSDLEARVITSFRTKLPAIFYGGGTGSSTDEYISLASKLKSYSDWHALDGSSGVSQRISRGLNEVQDRVRQVGMTMTTHPEVLRLSNGLLVDSINFINRLLSFIDMQHMELNLGTYFTEAQVWEILVATIERIFEDMRAARAPVQDVVGDTDRSGLLWGILKSHEVMKRYVTNDFRNDPSIHGILVQKMLKCSPTTTVTSKVAQLERNLNAVTGKMTTLNTRVTQLEAKK